MIVRFTSLSFVLLLSLLLGCTKQEQQKTSNQTSELQSDNVAEVISVETRTDKVSNFSWKDNSGKTVDLDAFRGKVTLVNFWATWCGPCKRELPDLVALNSELANHGVKVIGVSTDRGANVIEDVRSFVKDQHIPYQIVISNEELEEAFGNVRLLPTSFLIDAEGKIVQTYVGPRSKTFFSEAILAVLK